MKYFLDTEFIERKFSIYGLGSWAEAIDMTTRLVACLWPDARTVHELYGYCSGCPTWSGHVASVMASMGSGPGLRWEAAL